MADETTPLSYPEPPLTDGVITLRPWLESDLSCVREASSDPYIPEWTTIPSRFSKKKGREWIERQRARFSDGEGLSLAIADKQTDEAVGCAFLITRSQPGTVGIGYWVLERTRGRGFASRAVALLARWALTTNSARRVDALVEPDNRASQRVLERVGFTQEGHLRSYLAFEQRRADALIYSLLPSDLDE